MTTRKITYSQLYQNILSEVNRYSQGEPLQFCDKSSIDAQFEKKNKLTAPQKKLLENISGVFSASNSFETEYKIKIDELLEIYYYQTVIHKIPSSYLYQYFPSKFLFDSKGILIKDYHKNSVVELMITSYFIHLIINERGFHSYLLKKSLEAIERIPNYKKYIEFSLLLKNSNGLEYIRNYINCNLALYEAQMVLNPGNYEDINLVPIRWIEKNGIFYKKQIEANVAYWSLKLYDFSVMGTDRLKIMLKLYSKYLTTIRRKQQKEQYVKDKRNKYQKNEAALNKKAKKLRDAKIIQLKKTGMTHSEIAKSFTPQISRTTVIKVIRMNEIDKLYKQGKSVLDISLQLKIEYKKVHNYLIEMKHINSPSLPEPFSPKLT
ncbi:MAG: hypothetical protein KQH79_01075 [Bacteroidetes bacterium]|nr:hypothetical protein [Bacteroidota bacterium]